MKKGMKTKILTWLCIVSLLGIMLPFNVVFAGSHVVVEPFIDQLDDRYSDSGTSEAWAANYPYRKAITTAATSFSAAGTQDGIAMGNRYQRQSGYRNENASLYYNVNPGYSLIVNTYYRGLNADNIPFTFQVSSDFNQWQTVDAVISDLGLGTSNSSLSWYQRSYRIAIPDGMYYAQISFPDDKTYDNWAIVLESVQLSKVEKNFFADNLSDLSKIYKMSYFLRKNSVQGTVATNYDTLGKTFPYLERVQWKTASTGSYHSKYTYDYANDPQYAIYEVDASDGIKISIRQYKNSTASGSDFLLYASNDLSNWTQLNVKNTTEWNYIKTSGATLHRVTGIASDIPTDTKYVKVQWALNTNSAWSPSLGEFKVTSLYISDPVLTDNGDNTVTAAVTLSTNNAQVFVASYDENNELKSVGTQAVTASGDYNLTVEKGELYKVFLWNANLQPMCKAIQKTLD